MSEWFRLWNQAAGVPFDLGRLLNLVFSSTVK